MKNILAFMITVFCCVSIFGQGITLEPNGDINMDGDEPKLSFRSSSGSEITGSLKLLNSGMYLENREATPIYFQTEDMNRMVIDEIGNVGIGTINPLSELHVNGDIRLSDGTGRISFYEGTVEKSILSYNGTDITLRNMEIGDSDIFITTVDDIIFSTNNINRLFINQDGNVGIGTTTPQDKLQVRGAIRLESETNNNSFSINTGGNGNLRIVSEDSEDVLMSIDDVTGNVGININPARALLHIKENINNQSAFIIEDDANTNDWGFDITLNDLNFRYNEQVKGFFNQTDGNYFNSSDKRLKTNIEPMKNGILDKLLLLEPSTYHYKDDKERTVRSYGYIAQEAQKVFPEVVAKSGTKEEYLMISYSKIGILTVKAIQELNAKVEAKNIETTQLKEALEQQMDENINYKKQLVDLTTRMLALENNLQSCCLQHHENGQAHPEENLKTFDKERPQLQQNFPNPFSQQTEIQYYLPTSVQSAQIHITDLTGKALKTYQLVDKGLGKVTLNAGQLAIGTYHYSLIIDGKLVDTKRMILTK